MKTLLSIIVVLALLAGGWYFYNGGSMMQKTENVETTENMDAGSVKQDAALIVTETIRGKWQSTEDAKFVRVFKEGDVVEDWYDNEVVATGLWVAFEKGVNAPEVPFPLEDNAIYIQATITGSQADTLNFKVAKLTETELELIYLDRGGVLAFTRVQ